MEITRDMLIVDILKLDVELSQFLFEIGMHCLGCPASRMETIEQACEVHDTDCDQLLEKMNGFLANKAK